MSAGFNVQLGLKKHNTIALLPLLAFRYMELDQKSEFGLRLSDLRYVRNVKIQVADIPRAQRQS